MNKRFIFSFGWACRNLAILALLFAMIGGCASGDDQASSAVSDNDQPETSMESEDRRSVSAEREALSTDSTSLDPKALLERENESPMTELESVDDVALSEEEQRAAEEAAAEAERYTKSPSQPDDK